MAQTNNEASRSPRRDQARIEGLFRDDSQEPEDGIEDRNSSDFNKSAVGAAMRHIEEKIASGSLQVGRLLPKISVLAAGLHCSNSTIIEAYRLLADRGLIHKKGKFWCVGPHVEHRKTGSSLHHDAPIVLVLQCREYEWKWLAGLPRTAQFCQRFVSEAQHFGVALSTAFTGVADGTYLSYPAGWENIRKWIEANAQRYAGTLIISDRERMPDIGEWVSRLIRFKKHVVWLDRHNEGIPEVASSRYFTRLHASEEETVFAAVALLHELGHRNIATAVTAYGTGGWQVRRKEQLRSAARKLDVKLSVVEKERPEPDRGSPLSEEQKVGAYDDVMQGILADRAISAVISPNDYSAYYLYHWMHSRGVQVPKDISLLSFDNDLLLNLLPITTFDFGLGLLGYKGFHLVFDVLPVKGRTSGAIAATPELIDRGSVAPPSSGPLMSTGW